jgi:hypothetical protein
MNQKPIAARIAAKVNTTNKDGCHLWTGSVMRANGYPQISAVSPRTGKRTMRNVHVCVFELANDMPVPEGMVVCHAIGCCKTCVNPAHLRLGTHRDNAMDRIAEGRASKRLRKAEVIEIVALNRRYGMSAADLANRFRMDPSVTRRILRGEAWGSVTGIERHRGVGGRRRKSDVVQLPVAPKVATYGYARHLMNAGGYNL